MKEYKEIYKELYKKINNNKYLTQTEDGRRERDKLINFLDNVYKDIKKKNIIPFNNMNLFKELFEETINFGNYSKSRTLLFDLINEYNNQKLNYYIEEKDEVSIKIFRLYYRMLLNYKVDEYEMTQNGIIAMLNNFYLMFENKNLLLIIVEHILKKQPTIIRDKISFNLLIKYFIKARLNFNDEYSYVSYCMDFINKDKFSLCSSFKLLNTLNSAKLYTNEFLYDKYISKNKEIVNEIDIDKYKELNKYSEEISDLNKKIYEYLNKIIVNNYDILRPNFDEIIDYIYGGNTDSKYYIYDMHIKKLKENGMLFHKDFKYLLWDYLNGYDILVTQEKGSGFTYTLNQMCEIFDIKMYKLDYNYLLKYIESDEETRSKEDLFLIRHLNLDKGILLIETTFENQEELDDEVAKVYENLEKFNLLSDHSIDDVTYLIVNKVDKVTERYNYLGKENIQQEYFTHDEELERDIVNDNELYEFIEILNECCMLTLRDIVNITKYYKSNLFSIREIFDMTLKNKEIDKVLFELSLSRLESTNKIIEEFSNYINNDYKKRIR